MTLSDKPFMGSVTAPERAEDTVEMCKILFGEDFVDSNCVVTNLINANSPMVFDDTMLGAAKVYARNNQACVVSPFILAGAMSPVTVAGTLTQVLAEVLAGASFTQLDAAPVRRCCSAPSRHRSPCSPVRTDLRHAGTVAGVCMVPPSWHGGLLVCRSAPAVRFAVQNCRMPRRPMKAPPRST